MRRWARICRVSVVMLKLVRNRDIDFNALLSKVGQSLVAARVGGVMTSAIIRGVHRAFSMPCFSLIARTKKVAINLLEPYISYVE